MTFPLAVMLPRTRASTLACVFAVSVASETPARSPPAAERPITVVRDSTVFSIVTVPASEIVPSTSLVTVPAAVAVGATMPMPTPMPIESERPSALAGEKSWLQTVTVPRLKIVVAPATNVDTVGESIAVDPARRDAGENGDAAEREGRVGRIDRAALVGRRDRVVPRSRR